MPKFHEQKDGSLVCRHRDLSVCGECAKDPMVVEIFGAHFIAYNQEELTELKRIAAEV